MHSDITMLTTNEVVCESTVTQLHKSQNVTAVAPDNRYDVIIIIDAGLFCNVWTLLRSWHKFCNSSLQTKI